MAKRDNTSNCRADRVGGQVGNVAAAITILLRNYLTANTGDISDGTQQISEKFVTVPPVLDESDASNFDTRRFGDSFHF